MAEALKILFASTEAVPFVKAGGLADVAGSLPGALRALGHDARLVLPHYGMIDNAVWGIEPLFTFDLERPGSTTPVQVSRCDTEGAPTYFIRARPWLGDDRQLYYGWDWDVTRFLSFSQAVVEMLSRMGLRENGLHWLPDVIHANDWHTGLIPFLVRQSPPGAPLARTASLYTIHNVGYQGAVVGGFLADLNLPPRDHPLLARFGKTDNLMALGIAYADAVNTVSPRYAMELQQEYFGYGLDPLLRARAAEGDFFGVLNGIDTICWNPATDPELAACYDADSLDQRAENKRALQAQSGLPVRDPALVIGMISRLVEQKGLDVVLPALRRLLPEADVQFVLLGTGQPYYMDGVRALAQDFPGQVRAFLEFGGIAAQRIYAGCDVFLMPSRYEPGGLGQMIAMRYGALPVVRATGGLADTVVNYDGGDADAGTGFVFESYSVEALLGTLRWVIDTFHARPAAWRRMQRRAMRNDFSWDASAREYVKQYRRMISRRESATLVPGG